MTSIPEGLVTTAGDAPSKLDGLDGIEIGGIAHLWKVYNTNPAAHRGMIGHRLENFFWRIWGSELLLSTLQGSTLAKLFQQISDGAQPLAFVRMPARANASSAKKDSPEKKPTRPPLPPILKKPNSSQGDLHKTTRLLLTSPGGQSFTRNPSNPPTPIPPSVSIMGSDPVSKQKKAQFAANASTKNQRRRPVVMRRKSSRSNSSAHAHSPEHPSPLSSEVWVDLPDEETSSPGETLAEETITPIPEPDPLPSKPKLPAPFVARLKAQMKAHPSTNEPPIISYRNPPTVDPDRWYGIYRQRSDTLLVDGVQVETQGHLSLVDGAQVKDSDEKYGLVEKSEPRPLCALSVQSIDGSVDRLSYAMFAAASADTRLADGPSPGSGSFAPTPRSDGLDADSNGLGVSVPASTPSGITMDVTFEELDELSPKVW